MNKVKVRVKKLGGPEPLYQQNENGSLDTGTFPLTLKKESKGINDTEKIVGEEEANVELEKGEVVFKPEQMTKVLGKSHKNGGSFAYIEDPSFVFSHYLKLSDAEKEALGKKGKNISYADVTRKLVKPFNEAINTYKTSTDRLDKDTAALSLMGMKEKLGKIALLQESQKGFPNGIPSISESIFEGVPEEEGGDTKQVMKYGGVKKMQGAGSFPILRNLYPGRGVSKSDFDKSMGEGYTFLPGTRKVAYKKTNVEGVHYKKYAKKMADEEWYENYVKPQLQKGVHPDDIVKGGGLSREGKDKSGELYFNRAFRDYKPRTDIIYYEDEIFPTKSTFNNNIPQSDTEGNIKNEPNPSPRKSDDKIATGDAGNTYGKNFKDTGYGWMEGINIAAPFAQKINKYAPVRQQIEARRTSFRPVDFEGARQSYKGMIGTAQKQNALLSPNSSIASSRNAQLLGQTGPINESFMNEFNTNQLGYQQVEEQNQARQQQADIFNASAADTYATNYAKLNENFDARKAQRFAQFLKGWNTAETSRQKRNMLNYLMTDYEIGPNQEISRLRMSDNQMMARLTGSDNTGGTGDVVSMAKDQLRSIGRTDDYFETDQGRKDILAIVSRLLRTNVKTESLDAERIRKFIGERDE